MVDMKLYIKEDYEDDIEIINNELSLIPASEDDLDLIIEDYDRILGYQ